MPTKTNTKKKRTTIRRVAAPKPRRLGAVDNAAQAGATPAPEKPLTRKALEQQLRETRMRLFETEAFAAEQRDRIERTEREARAAAERVAQTRMARELEVAAANLRTGLRMGDRLLGGEVVVSVPRATVTFLAEFLANIKGVQFAG